MHTYVYFSTIHNSKDMESTQVPIKDRLDKENSVYIHHGILRSYKKRMRLCSLQGHEVGSHYSQQINKGTENQTPKWEVNIENTWTQGGEHYTLGSIGGTVEGQWGGELGRDSMGRNARYR